MTEEFTDRPLISDVVSGGDRHESLRVMRDFVAHELDGNRCSKCHMSQMRTGDIASLILRLQKIIEDIDEIERAAKKTETAVVKGVTNLASIRNRRATAGSPDTPDTDNSKLGTKAGTRRSSPGRRNTR